MHRLCMQGVLALAVMCLTTLTSGLALPELLLRILLLSYFVIAASHPINLYDDS